MSMTNYDSLRQLLAQQLSLVFRDAPAPDSVRLIAAQLGAADDVVERLVADLCHSQPRPVEPDATPPLASSAPRLFVDWGELPRVGHQVRPEFSLVCPGYSAKPDIRVFVDRDLDHNGEENLRRLRCEEPELWTFHVPFRMTTEGQDCRPGHYVIEVHVSFSEASTEQVRFFCCQIRLNVPRLTHDETVLEISGDGQSVVNLQGYDLKSFSRVILKGGQTGLINLHNALALPGGAPAATPVTKAAVAFEYVLKRDLERQNRLPTVSTHFTRRASLERAGLFFADGRRILLIPKRRVALGRNRENDIVIRFLPRSPEHDDLSRNISRTHVTLELNDHGLIVRDESSMGLALNAAVLDKTETVTSAQAREPIRMELGWGLNVPTPFELDLDLFTIPEDEDRDLWDREYCAVAGEAPSRLWQSGVATNLNAARLTRIRNLTRDESYVLLFREALIGRSATQCPIRVETRSSQPVARLLYIGQSFWLEKLLAEASLVIDGIETPIRHLVPLVPGMKWTLDGVEVKFDEFRQCGME